jgi:hypothetical protein
MRAEAMIVLQRRSPLTLSPAAVVAMAAHCIVAPAIRRH